MDLDISRALAQPRIVRGRYLTLGSVGRLYGAQRAIRAVRITPSKRSWAYSVRALDGLGDVSAPPARVALDGQRLFRSPRAKTSHLHQTPTSDGRGHGAGATP